MSVGDFGGRVIIFKRVTTNKSSVEDFQYFCEFQSHEPSFDYLKSTEIGEKINAVEWINNNESALRVVSANDKVIKLWKISYKR